jgi:hypothetical protein
MPLPIKRYGKLPGTAVNPQPTGLVYKTVTIQAKKVETEMRFPQILFRLFRLSNRCVELCAYKPKEDNNEKKKGCVF